MMPVLPAPERQQRPHVRDILHPLEEGDQVHEIAIRRVADPALYRDCVVCF
jgi:hypothetical protein